MKRSMLVALLMGCVATAYAKHDGWYVNEVTTKRRTPHLEWNKGFAPLNTLFITQRGDAWSIVELAERMPFNVTPFIYSAHNIYIGDGYEAAATGTSRYEKEQEIRAKLQTQYDLIRMTFVSFESMPPDAQYRILQQVENGAGWVTNVKPRFKKLYLTPLPPPDFLDEIVLPPGVEKEKIKAYQFGKGRILHLEKSAVIPVGNRWQAEHENNQLFQIRCAWWAARRDTSGTPLKVEKQGNELLLKTAEAVDYRLRDEFNTIVKTGSVKNGKIELPALTAGRYYCDLLAPGKNIGSHAFEIASPLGKIAINMQDESIADRKAFKGTVSLEKPAGSELKLRLNLMDAPNGRIWARQEMKVKAGQESIPFEFKNYTMPNAAGYLTADLIDAGNRVIARCDKALFFPDWKLDDYYQIGFGASTNPVIAKELVEEFGFAYGLTGMGKDTPRNLSLLNVRLIPYLVRIGIGKSKANEVQLFMNGKWRDALKKIGNDQNFNRPEIRQLWVEYIQERMTDLPKYGPVLYSLGDENYVDLTSGFGASDLNSFREFLKNKYGTIAVLNREWGTSHQGFDAVPHRPLADSLKDKNYPEWNDHHEYMEKMFADIHHVSAAEIKKLDPRAKVGLEGTFGNINFELMMSKLDWWGPYTNSLEDALLRSLYPNVPRFVWCGYHGERGPGKYPSVARHLLLGNVNGNGWYAASAGDPIHDILAVDGSPSYPKEFNDELKRLRFGIGQLMTNIPLHDSGIGIYWTHLLRRAARVDSRCMTPEGGIGPLIRFAYQNGIGFEFVTGRTLDRLKKIKVMFLLGASTMTDKEAKAMLEFVKNGGTLIADLPPAVLNENLRKRTENPLSELFGNLTIQKEGQYEVRALNLPDLKASKAMVNPEGTFMAEKKYGKGKAILLNFNFSTLETAAGEGTSFGAFLRGLLNRNGIETPYVLDGSAALRIRDGNGFEVVGLYPVGTAKNASVKLPKKCFVYECGAGFVGEQDKIDAAFTGPRLRVYATFDKKQEFPALTLPKQIQAGGAVSFDLNAFPPGRILSIRVFAPDGKEMLERNVVLDTAKVRKYELAFPYNAAPGKYRLECMDVVTGLKQQYEVNVQ